MARESTLKNMVITLASITLVSSALLGAVYALTKGPIDAAQVAKINNAISKVVPAFDNNPSAEKFQKELEGKNYVVYPAKKGEEIVGYAVESFTTGGFGGRIVLMVGFKHLLQLDNINPRMQLFSIVIITVLQDCILIQEILKESGI